MAAALADVPGRCQAQIEDGLFELSTMREAMKSLTRDSWGPDAQRGNGRPEPGL